MSAIAGSQRPAFAHQTIHRDERYNINTTFSALPYSTPHQPVRRETRPLSKGRCANETSNEPKSHPNRTHRRGRRSITQQSIHKSNRRQARAFHRKEYRRVRQCWKALAKHPATLSLAQERILATINNSENPTTETKAEDTNQKHEKKSNIHEPPKRQLSTHNQNLRIATLNIRGMNYITARQQIVYVMKKHHIDVLALLETHVNYTGKEIHDNYIFYFSSVVDDDQRKRADKELEMYNDKCKKEKIPQDEAKRERMRIRQRAAEKLGCAFVYKAKLNLEINVQAIDNKNISMTIDTKPIPINIAATHAPHANHTIRIKSSHYAGLEQQMDKWKPYEVNFLLGDFNARLLEQLPQECTIIGKHIYRTPTSTIQDLSEQQRQNRHLFTEFCLSRKMIPMNTWFDKPSPLLATYRNVNTTQFNRTEVDMSTHAQMDFILINDRWKNAFSNITTIQETILDADHALLIADVHLKLAQKKRDKRQLIPQSYRTPTQTQKHAYNLFVEQKIEEQRQLDNWNCTKAFDTLADILIESADKYFTRIPAEQKKPYLSETTWNLIEAKQKAIEENDFMKARDLSKNIRLQGKKDKEWVLLQELEEITRDGYKWDGLKRARKTFQPKRYKFKNKHGELIKEKDFPSTAAEYFAEIQWAQPEENDLDPEKEATPLIEGTSNMNDELFTLPELDNIIDAQKNNKTPGPDGCRAELVKWLSVTNRNSLLSLYNDMIQRHEFPESFKKANLVAIYKKGDATQMQNYRPIALLQVFYKILAGMIRTRLLHAYDPWIQKSQYGFRPRKSTTQAIFIARRLLDLAERQHSNLSLILLDWEKAFDKVNQTKLLQVLRRLKVPPNMFQLIASMYQDPLFRIKMDNQCSDYKSQESGIRQGCPLSPFLFTLLMSAMFKDIKAKLNTPKQREPLPGIEFAEILYADDTLIFGNHTHTINKLLHAIQAESRYYNMSLNYDKCINLTLNQGTSSVKYIDGTLVPRKHEATYLGSILTDTVDNHREVCNRIADATVTCNRLKLFWNKAQNTVKWS